MSNFWEYFLLCGMGKGYSLLGQLFVKETKLIPEETKLIPK